MNTTKNWAAVRKDYQNQEIDTSQPAVPEQVSVALAALAGEMREGLLALAVGAGLQVMAALMEADVTAACGPKGRHDPERTATRHGHGAGSVSLGGRRVPGQRPRMGAADGPGAAAGEARGRRLGRAGGGALRAVLRHGGRGGEGGGRDARGSAPPPLPPRA